MGHLNKGVWLNEVYDTSKTGGRYIRDQSAFRHWITPDGSAGPSGKAGFKAEIDRYHLYVSFACPWAHRTLLFRSLKGLEDIIPVSIVHWFMGENGWTFDQGSGVVADPINQASALHEVYTAARPDYTGRVTVPVLWDKKQSTIVSNESSEIIRMFNSAFDGVGANSGNYYPPELQTKIDELNERIYESLNNGVYKSGFATKQKIYDDAVLPLFETLDWLEELLGTQRYLTGAKTTEADWRLFTTLVRFDTVYFGHFKCNLKSISEHPNLSNYLRDLYQTPGVPDTVNMQHIKGHYYESHTTVNPTGIVPAGPRVTLEKPHNRGRF